MHTSEKLLFVDLETTGANAIHDRITEIGIVSVECDGTVDRWSSFINPGMPIPPFIQQLTGINNDMVRDAPSFEALSGEIAARLENGLFIAHNARFDYGFLFQSFARVSRKLQAEVLCTVKLSRRLYPEEKKHNLDILIERHALIPAARHRALADADLLWQLWNRLQTIHALDAFNDAIRTLRHVPVIALPEDIADAHAIPQPAAA